MSKYDYQFSWNTPAGHAIRLVDDVGLDKGVVLDLGCGMGAPGAELERRGFDYVGLDIDQEHVRAVTAAGFESHRVDLSDPSLDADLSRILNGRPVSCLLALDTLEHLVEPSRVLAALYEFAKENGHPALVISIPNVAHLDLGIKLLVGRWDLTDTGLLDRTHVGFFTAERLTREFRSTGWLEVARHDLELYQSDQRFPSDHPALIDKTPVHRYLASLRSRSDDHSRTNQFVRAYVPMTPVTPSEDPVDGEPDLSVLMRTRGDRPHLLLEALLCLAAQTVDAFDVWVLVHSTDEQDLIRTREVIDQFHSSFAERVHVVPVEGGGRARPLNVGLQAARGGLIAFLDDDDLVTGDWVETFLDGAESTPGAVVRARAATQRADLIREPHRTVRATAAGPPVLEYDAEFDFVTHLCRNNSPICSYAIPRGAVEHFRLRFDEDLDVLEDWDLLMRTASLCGVVSSPAATSIYRRWEIMGSHLDTPEARWRTHLHQVLGKLDTAPLLLPAGSAQALSDMRLEHMINSAQVETMSSQLEQLNAHVAHLEEVLEYEAVHRRGAEDELAAVHAHAHHLKEKIDQTGRLGELVLDWPLGYRIADALSVRLRRLGPAYRALRRIARAVARRR